MSDETDASAVADPGVGTAAPTAGDPAASDPGAPDALADQPGATAAEPLAQAWDLLAAGGPVVAILLGLSVLALAIVLAKAVQFAGPALAGQDRARRAVRLFRDGEPARPGTASRGAAASPRHRARGHRRVRRGARSMRAGRGNRR